MAEVKEKVGSTWDQIAMEQAGSLDGIWFTADIVLQGVKKQCDTLYKEAAVQGTTRDDTNIVVEMVVVLVTELGGTIMEVYLGICTRLKIEEESDLNNICHSLVTYSCRGGANPHWQQLSYKQSISR